MNWRELNKYLMQLSEEELLKMLNEERVGARRLSALTRIHQRYNALRNVRERNELLAEAKAP
jgi:hypothetical protein